MVDAPDARGGDLPVGRDAIVAALTDVVRAGSDGAGRSVVLYGPPGVGLTTLLDAVAASAPALGVDVLAARGRPAERELHRTVLRDLAAAAGDPDLSRVVTMADDSELPASFTDALLARTTQTLVAVDDLDHVDAASLAAIRFLAHRAGRGSVSVIAACHDAATAADVPTLEVPGLDAEALAAVLRSRPTSGDLADQVVAALHRITSGNPLAALQIAATLTLPQRVGSEPLPEFPTLAADLVAAVSRPLADLPAATRHALALAAAEPSGDLRALALAAPVLGVDLSALAAAEEAGIVVLDIGHVVFDLPVRRWAVYHSIAAPSRRAAHRALASVHDAPEDAERRALHLALGATEPDERIAADIELAALAAERRGEPSAARQWWQHAARLSPIRADAEARRRRARLATDDASGPLASLTAAERSVAVVVGKGASNKGAATALGVSVKTVDTHLQAIYRKLGLRSRSELAVVVARHDGDADGEVG